MFDHDPEQQARQGQDPLGLDLDPFFGPHHHGHGAPPPEDFGNSGDGGLHSPGLGSTGRGVEFAEGLLGDMESQLGPLNTGDKQEQLAKIDQVALKKHEEVHAEVEQHEVQHEALHQQEAGNDVEGPVTAPVTTPAKKPPPRKPPPSVKMAGDREGMRTQITTAGEKELEQIDAALDKQLADLDKRFEKQLGGLDKQIGNSTKDIDGHTGQADQSLEKQIGKNDAAHQKQIKTEAGKHQTEVATQQQSVTDLQAYQQEKAAHATLDQGEKTVAHGAQQAERVRQNGRFEAQNARNSGNAKAKQAVDAAEARAKQLEAAGKGKEAAPVRADGQTRAKQARDEGERTAKQIEARAEATAKQLVADGERAAGKTVSRGTTAKGSIDSAAQKQNGRIQTQADVASAEMQQHASNAHGAMEAERAKFQAQAGGARDTATGNMDKEREEANKKAEKLKADTAEQMRKTHATERKKVEAKIQKMLADLDKAKDNELSRVGRRLGQDLYSLEQSDGNVDRAMKKQVKRADNKLKLEIEARKKKVRAEALKAKCAVDKFVAEARKRVAAADKGTAKDIAGAAKRGMEAIENVGVDAANEFWDASQKTIDKIGTDGEKDRKGIDKTVDKSTKELAKLATGVEKNVDKQWVDDAVKQANEKLDDSGIFNVVTDGEANRAMNILTSLPPAAQGQAVDKLDKDAFANLLDEVPKNRREEFEPLVKNAKDPERKLALWGEFHKSEVKNDIEREKGDIGQDNWFWQKDTAEQKENKRRHEARVNAGKQTEKEIEEETKFLQDQKNNGKPFTADDVDKLMERKGTEHDIEMKYNTNLTNKEGARKDGSKIVWTKKELDALEASFQQLPESHMAGNSMLTELNRSDVLVENGKENPNVGGQHGGGVITVFDGGALTSGNGYRHGGDRRELASPYICGRCGVTITILDMVVTHEIGHDMHDQNDEAFAKFQKISGWENKDKAAMKKSGLSDADIKALDDTRDKGYWERKEIRKDGKIYMVDPYGGGYLVVDDTALPEKGESEAGAGGGDKDTWAYARSNYKDHFAEMYAKAVHVPEKLHKDLVDNPHKKTEDTKKDLKDAQDNLSQLQSTGGSAADVKAAEDEIKKQEAALKRAEKAEDQRSQEFKLMRNDIFHTDDAQSDAEKRLQEKGMTPDKLKEFKDKAAKCSTPEQIKTLEEEYK